MKHLLKLADLSAKEITELLNLADQLKYEKKHGIEHHLLKGKTLGMIFQKSSTRTRVSFEVGMYYLDGIMIRTFEQKEVEDLAEYGSIPIINGLTDYCHPCQVLADLLTIREHKGALEGNKLCFIGDGNNMANSLIVGGIKTGMEVSIACPDTYKPDSEIMKWANENGKLISHLNASKIISNVGDDLNLLKNEVNKIAAYAKGEEITDRDIDLLSTVNLEARTYDMADDVINGRGDRAFRKLDTLFCQREEPINILYALSSAYVDAYRMRVADECSVSKETVAKDFAYKNRAFVLNRARTSVSRTSTEALRKSLDVLVETDEKLKSVSVNQRFLIEQLISRLLLIAKEGRI